jgi:hypothetical protein
MNEAPSIWKLIVTCILATAADPMITYLCKQLQFEETCIYFLIKLERSPFMFTKYRRLLTKGPGGIDLQVMTIISPHDPKVVQRFNLNGLFGTTPCLVLG